MTIHFQSTLCISFRKIIIKPALIGIACFFTVVTAKAQTWPILGSENQLASAASGYTSITAVELPVGDDGYITVPYVAFTEANIAKVKRYINGEWESVGGNVSEGSASYTYIFSDENGKVYLNYIDQSSTGANRLAVKTFNTATNTWEPVGGKTENLYLSSGTIKTNVSQLNNSHNSWMAFDSNNMPYVIFSEFSAGGNPFVKRFNGASWEVVGNSAVSADNASGVSIAIDQANNTPYIVYLGGTSGTPPLKVYAYSGAGWNVVPLPDKVVAGANSGNTDAARHSALVLDNDNNLYVGYFNAGNSNKATIIKRDKNTTEWSLSGVVSTRDIFYLNLTRNLNGDLYASFADKMANSGSRSVSRVFKLPVSSSVWGELTNSEVNEGIDDPTSAISFAGTNNKEYVVYTKSNTSSISTPVVRVFSSAPPPPPEPDSIVNTPRQMESLNRGVVAVRLNSNQVYIGWRMLGTDPDGIAFNIYRDGTKLNAAPITTSTNYTDNSTAKSTYTITPIINGVEQAAAAPVSVWNSNYLSIPLQIPKGGTTPTGESYTYNANDASVGDLDGDGEYEIILKWDPSNSKDNSQSGYTGNVYLDAYKLNGTLLWRIDLGRNIRAGAHYTQFMVYDFDGDGYAEVACKTADGTIDGVGTVIGNANADYRNSSGYVLDGPEFLTMFNGKTGAAMATKDYLPGRGTVSSWGDNYGNRVDRFVSAVAYLDGARPSLIMGRGYYTRLVRAAWDWRDGKLTSRWVFDSNSPGNSSYAGQGNHQMTIGDVDGDGKDEIFNGSSAVNDNGAGLWANGKGHGDAMHMSYMDSSLDGQQIWACLEDPGSYAGLGLTLKSAKTGELIWGVPATGDIGRAMAADIDPRYPGYEMWGATGGNVYTNKGVAISNKVPSMNFGIWWDGDLSRELLDGTKLDKWNPSTNSSERLFTIYDVESTTANNGTKSNPALTADILGDWREEMIFRNADNTKLLLFTTNIPTEHRIYTLMHDPQYRVAVAWQNSAYNQPPHPGFFLGTDMAPAPKPNIYLAEAAPSTPSISVNGPTTICEGAEVILTSSASSGNQWYKDGAVIANEKGITFKATVAGSYAVKTNTLCCSSALSEAVNITVNPTPVATIMAGGPLAFPEGGSVLLNATAGAGYTYKWIKNGTGISGATDVSYTASASGSYRVSIDLNGCVGISPVVVVTEKFSLPVSNFRIAITDESCNTSNNGKITITPTENLSYIATLKYQGDASNLYNFNGVLEIKDLEARNYSLCIVVDGRDNYQQCYENLVVKEPRDLSVFAKLNGSNNTVSLDLLGGDSYVINLNGVSQSTTLNSITLALAGGNNQLLISTDKPCQGVVEKNFFVSNKIIVYPNPFEKTLSIKLGSDLPQHVNIEVKTIEGKSVYKKQFINAATHIDLDLSQLPKGLHVLQLSSDKLNSAYKILKQ